MKILVALAIIFAIIVAWLDFVWWVETYRECRAEGSHTVLYCLRVSR